MSPADGMAEVDQFVNNKQVTKDRGAIFKLRGLAC
jgi:hypothetical protein